MSPVKDTLLGLIKSAASTGDVYPFPLVVETVEGALEIHGLAVPPQDVLPYIQQRLQKRDVQAFGYARDRSTREGQGTTRSSVATWAVFGNSVEVGIVEYDAGETVDEPRTNCGFWNEIIEREAVKLLVYAMAHSSPLAAETDEEEV